MIKVVSEIKDSIEKIYELRDNIQLLLDDVYVEYDINICDVICSSSDEPEILDNTYKYISIEIESGIDKIVDALNSINEKFMIVFIDGYRDTLLIENEQDEISHSKFGRYWEQ